MNQIEKLQADNVLIDETIGEISLALDKKPGDKGLQDQRRSLEAEIASNNAKAIDLRRRAAAAEQMDKKAADKALLDGWEAVEKNLHHRLGSAKTRSPKIDSAMDTLLQLFTEHEQDLRAVYETAIDVGIPYEQIRFLIELAPLGVALADRLCRGGWTKLPFIDISHPRDPATVEQMTRVQHASVLVHLKRAQLKRAP